MKVWAVILVVLGLVNVVLGLVSRRLGSPYWRSRLWVGVVVTLAGVYGWFTW